MDGRHVSLTHAVERGSLPEGLFNERLLERGYTEVLWDAWPTSATEFPPFDRVIMRTRRRDAEFIVGELGHVLVHGSVHDGRASATVAGPDAATVDATLRRLHEAMPAPDPTSKHEVRVTFWTYGRYGPTPVSRSITVPSWSEIRDNYASGTRDRLDRAMDGFRPSSGGQLVLWHGAPGTGKTYGLRALAWEWRGWCDLHYVVDPDTFFGQHADYLMSVLLQSSYDSDADEESTRWRVLVLEDTGELLSADARQVVGAGLSRFLNVVDGLIGQGLRVLVLVTTNEPIGELHPAVARPGRCAAKIEFEPLGADEAAAWLAARGVADGAGAPATLAELYAWAEGRDPDESLLVGFGDDGN
jgi:hypothetical protein